MRHNHVVFSNINTINYLIRTLCYALSSCSGKELAGTLSGYKGCKVL